MSKEFKNMDDLFQSAFADEATEVPAFVKTNIDKKLGLDRKNKFGSLFPAILLIGIATATTIYFTVDSTESDFAQSTTSNQNQINPTPSNNNSVAITTDEYSNSEIENNSTNLNQSTENNNSINKNFKTTSSNSKNINDKKNKNDLNKGIDDDALSVKQTSIVNTNDGAFTIVTNDFHGTVNGLGDGDGENSGSGSSSGSSSSSGSEGLDTTNNSDENNSVGDVTENQSRSFGTDSTINSDDKLINATTETNDDVTSPPVEVNEGDEKYNPWMLTLTGGLNLTKSNYTSTQQLESELYTQSTNDRPSFETNFEAKYRLNNGLTFGSGFGFTQFAENYYYNKIDENVDTFYTYNYIYDLIDSTLIIDSTIATTNYDTTIVNIYNATGETKANYVTLPISIGTQIIYKKFRFDLFALGKFNYLVSASGGYILNDAFVPFTKNNNPIFKPWYFDMMLGATVHYQLFEKLYLSGTFRYRPPFGQMYQGTSFNKSVQYTHLGIGLTLKF